VLGDSYEVIAQTLVHRCVFLLVCVQGPENHWEIEDHIEKEDTKESLLAVISNG
jgi:hypothetical protein